MSNSKERFINKRVLCISMEKEKLRQILTDQQKFYKKQEDLIERTIDLAYYLKGNEIIIVSGIRRCGKSSLLKLISKKIQTKKIFINFDDIRFVDFTVDNFQDIEDLIIEMVGTEKVTYFLDEIHNVDLWQKWVNNLYAKNIKVFVTGSNSTLLSSEIASYLTGRNKVIQLFPFSFKEYLHMKGMKNLTVQKLASSELARLYSLFMEYFTKGGFPLVIKNDDLELTRQYFDDILNKDVINRYKIKEVKELKDIILYLFTNIGSCNSYSTLKKISDIKSLSTIKNYIDYLQNVYLLYAIRRFDYSIKKQKISSLKTYAGDTSFLKTVAFNFSENKGKRLENVVFLQLKRQGHDIYYHHEKKECDFVIKEHVNIKEVIQVSLSLQNPITKTREVDGLLEAMKKYTLDKGLILTMEDEDIIQKGDKKIIIKPVWKWLLEHEHY